MILTQLTVKLMMLFVDNFQEVDLVHNNHGYNEFLYVQLLVKNQ